MLIPMTEGRTMDQARPTRWMTRTVPGFCLLLALAGRVDAQLAAGSFPSASPETAGLSSVKLREAMDSVRSWTLHDRIMGGILLVIRNGSIVFHEAAGWSDKERDLPLRIDQVVSMRSMTKPLVGTAVLMLIEEGRLRLDDRVSLYLPSFDNDRSREITVFQLLTHTSGITGEIYNDQDGTGTPYRSLREAVDSVGSKGPALTPGTQYSCSDPGTSTLGALIAQVSGMSAESFIRRRLLEPLGMIDSRLVLPLDDPLRPRIASTYRRENGQWARYWDNTQPVAVPFFRASGGLWSTAMDYARFMAMMLHRGRFDSLQILDPASVDLALQPHAAYVYSPDQQKERDRFYGLHWIVYTDRYRSVEPPFSAGTFEHSGSDGTLAWADPSRGLILIYLTQSRGQDTRNDLLRLVYASFTPTDPEPTGTPDPP
jgi:CubicO group peptidase (beta-lactamase class C family)